MQEIAARDEPYMKGEVNNAEKRSRGAKEKGDESRFRTEDFQHNTSKKKAPPP